MRILLDEDIPRGVRGILRGHHVRTAPEMRWGGLSNGQLLDEAQRAGFEAIITADQGFPFQQNIAARPIAVVVLSTNFWPTIRAQPQTLRRAVAAVSPGTFTFATFGRSRRRRAPAPTS
jgi:hypothetical protein